MMDMSRKIDPSAINFRFTGKGVCFSDSNRILDKLSKLDKGRFAVYRKGHPTLPMMPFVKNLKTGNIAKVTGTKNQYPYVSIGGVSVAMHRLVALCFIPNLEPDRKYIVDHRNITDGESGLPTNAHLCKLILDKFNLRGTTVAATPWYCDWRAENLSWTTNGENKKNVQNKELWTNIY